jgi:hypothetical protein
VTHTTTPAARLAGFLHENASPRTHRTSRSRDVAFGPELALDPGMLAAIETTVAFALIALGLVHMARTSRAR